MTKFAGDHMTIVLYSPNHNSENGSTKMFESYVRAVKIIIIGSSAWDLPAWYSARESDDSSSHEHWSHAERFIPLEICFSSVIRTWPEYNSSLLWVNFYFRLIVYYTRDPNVDFGEINIQLSPRWVPCPTESTILIREWSLISKIRLANW